MDRSSSASKPAFTALRIRAARGAILRAARFYFPALLLGAALVALVAIAMPDRAAAAGADSTHAPRFFWRGRPLPECKSFLITEVGAHYLLNLEKIPYRQREIFITADLGYMRNRNPREAIGGLIHFGGGGDFTGLGPGVRYRRWLADEIAADFTVGLDVIGSAEPGDGFGAPAPWAEVGISAADIVGVTLRGQRWTRSDVPTYFDGSTGSKGVTTWHIGAKGGSYLGAAGTVGFIALVAVVIVALSEGT
ncbi:MAG TPA: hypothetical protein VFU59_01330 [Candidatus Eisenbacteria bacterium]|nr:hypothetical protein [Candidatus Eisenbacteria bacterium]